MDRTGRAYTRQPTRPESDRADACSRGPGPRRDPLLERAALYLWAARVGDERRVGELVAEAARQQVRPFGVVPRGDQHVRFYEAAKALAHEHGVTPVSALPSMTPRAMPAQPLGRIPGVLRPAWWQQQARRSRATGGVQDAGLVVPCPQRSHA